MIKKKGLITVILFATVLATVNTFIFFGAGPTKNAAISGRLIEKIPELPLGLNISLVAFIAQWIILLLIILVAYANFIKHKRHEGVKTHFHIVKRKKSRSTTDLDTLYNLLKEKKTLNTGSIARLFKIPKEKALEWGRILEEHELADIEYPAFNDPEIKLNIPEEKDKNEKEEKERGKEKKQERTEEKTKEQEIKKRKEPKKAKRKKTPEKRKQKKPNKKVERKK